MKTHASYQFRLEPRIWNWIFCFGLGGCQDYWNLLRMPSGCLICFLKLRVFGPRQKGDDKYGHLMTSFLAQRACCAAVLYQARLVPELLEPTDKTTMGEPVVLSIRLATTGELLGQWTSAEVGDLRVWELKRLLCQVTDSAEYFSWQLHDYKCLIKDNFFVSDLGNMEQGLSLFATRRQLRLPTLDEQADFQYYVSIRHRRKLWKLISKGIQVTATTRGAEKVCVLVRAIEANYVEPSGDYSFPDTVQTLLWAQCDPNQAGTDLRLPLNQAIRSGDDHAVELLLRSQANPMRVDIGNDAPLLVAARVGAPNYVRLLLQFRARPPGPEGSYGSLPMDIEGAAEAAEEDQSRASAYALLAYVAAAFGHGPPVRPTPID